jgi:hypothetical protein
MRYLRAKSPLLVRVGAVAVAEAEVVYLLFTTIYQLRSKIFSRDSFAILVRYAMGLLYRIHCKLDA